ncbi:aldolase [Aceticella autotrophica]|uniref:fructose-bisphosphate aldolase n=2 Tax=Aceticella autotrophica TaxID=2755338 RepID=A0A975AXI4_9THEO|nr:aldolase [Aceticella autotrophica]
MDIKVPLDVPYEKRTSYINNLKLATQESGRLMLMAADQKAEHLNDDFFGEGVAKDDANPEHLFKIASNAKIGAFAAQLGLIARYAMDYPKIPYVIKLNSKTHLVKTSQRDPISTAWLDIKQIDRFRKQTGLNIVGVGYTIYPGSEYEHIMLNEAAKIIFEAHQSGLFSIIWAYPRGKAVKDEFDPHMIAGACGLAACLGSDFVKVNYPKKENENVNELFKEAIQAAGRTKVICAGGSSKDPKEFLNELYEQIHVSGVSGSATGRNIHQKPYDEAVKFCNAIFSIVVENKTLEEAFSIYQNNK